ncbi:MAG: hypothetical protein QGI14_06760 [Candidatus Poseidonia sp.]|nr:hypothetical protein [Poseidonia sp.]
MVSSLSVHLHTTARAVQNSDLNATDFAVETGGCISARRTIICGWR